MTKQDGRAVRRMLAVGTTIMLAIGCAGTAAVAAKSETRPRDAAPYDPAHPYDMPKDACAVTAGWKVARRLVGQCVDIASQFPNHSYCNSRNPCERLRGELLNDCHTWQLTHEMIPAVEPGPPPSYCKPYLAMPWPREAAAIEELRHATDGYGHLYLSPAPAPAATPH